MSVVALVFLPGVGCIDCTVMCSIRVAACCCVFGYCVRDCVVVIVSVLR